VHVNIVSLLTYLLTLADSRRMSALDTWRPGRLAWSRRVVVPTASWPIWAPWWRWDLVAVASRAAAFWID